jgi:poly [ADP-ribose] polymerase 6/8
LVDMLSKRTSSISKYCVLCDQPHVFSSNMLRPAVCSRDMCVFQFQELHIGSDSAESVATDAGVIDLLLTIFRSAALSARANAILLPFPSVAHPKDKKVLVLDPAKPNFEKVKEVLKSFPTTKDVVRCNDLHDLKQRLEKTEPLAYPLLEWVIASNRSHLIQMEPSAQISAMGTPHQFLLLTAPPEKECVFRERKAKYGTKFAFHGSRAENWHGILRNGLKNMSGTGNQLNGAAHGKGVYFAPLASASFGYSGHGSSAGVSSSGAAAVGESFLGDNMLCIALCEIIDDKINDHVWCWTVEDEANIMTRFFFAFATSPSESASRAQTSDEKFMREVQKAMSFYAL